MMKHRILTTEALFIALLIAGGPSAALACHELGDGCCDDTSGGICECGDEIQGNVTLTDDIVCASGTGLIFATNGATLDLDGYQIICSGSCYRGVDFSTHSGTVDGPGVIDGFTDCVFGNTTSGTKVQGIAALNCTYGINSVEDVLRNFMQGVGEDASEGAGVLADDNTLRVDDNVITNFKQGILLNYGTTSSLKLRRNTVTHNGRGLDMVVTADCNDGAANSFYNTFAGNTVVDVNGSSNCDLAMSKNLCITNSLGSDYACGASQLLTSWQNYDPTQ